MEHIISVESLGARVRVRDGQFVVQIPDLSGANNHREECFAPCNVHTLLIHPNTSVSADVLLLAEEHRVAVLVLNKRQLPAVFMSGTRYAASVGLWKRQLLVHNTPQGLYFAREWLLVKVRRKIEWLSKMRSYHRPGPSLEAINHCLSHLKDTLVRMSALPLNVPNAAASLRGIEGAGQKVYLETLSQMLPAAAKFDERSRQPAADLFNAALNYAYGILYNWAEQALWKAGLNPYIGCMHSDARHQKALLFDFIEQFRPWMDRIVFKLCMQREINTQHTQESPEGGYWLNTAGKAVLIKASRLKFKNETVEIDGKKWFWEHSVGYEAQAFATALATIALPAADQLALLAEYC